VDKTRTGRPEEERPATYVHHDVTPRVADVPGRWWDVTDWWTDPRLAYARGLHDGYRLGREDQDAIDDAVHRTAVRRARRHVEQVDRRRAADRGALAEYAHRKGWAA
jgi:hypothetical protein